MRNIFISIMIFFLLAACLSPQGGGTSTPQTSEVSPLSGASEVSATLTPTATATPTASITPTPTVPTKEAATEFVPDWKVAFETESIITEMGGAQIKTKIVTAEDLDSKQIGKIDLNDGEVNAKWSRENSGAAVNEFTMKLLRHVWGNNNPKADGVDANGYAQMIADCAKGEIGVEDVALPLKGVFVDGADQPQDVKIAPFCGKGGEGIRQVDEVVYVFRNAANVEGLTVVDESSGYGNKIELTDKTLYLTLGSGTSMNKKIQGTSGSIAKKMAGLPSFLIGKKSFFADYSFMGILVDEWRASCFRGAVQVFDSFDKMSNQEQTCNP
jgi:hypothetical protein